MADPLWNLNHGASITFGHNLYSDPTLKEKSLLEVVSGDNFVIFCDNQSLYGRLALP